MAEPSPERGPSIGDLSGFGVEIGSMRGIEVPEVVPPSEAGERNLQRTLAEVLVMTGISWEAAYVIADLAWDVHRAQMERGRYISGGIPESREISERELARLRRRRLMTLEEQEAEDKDPRQHAAEIEEVGEDYAEGRYFSFELVGRGEATSQLPRLAVVKADPEKDIRTEEVEDVWVLTGAMTKGEIVGGIIGPSEDEVTRVRRENTKLLGSSPLVNGMTTDVEEVHGAARYVIRVNLVRRPTKEEELILPVNVDGIPVRYEIGAEVIALSE